MLKCYSPQIVTITEPMVFAKKPRFIKKWIKRCVNNKCTFKASENCNLPNGCVERKVLPPVHLLQYHLRQAGRSLPVITAWESEVLVPSPHGCL